MKKKPNYEQVQVIRKPKKIQSEHKDQSSPKTDVALEPTEESVPQRRESLERELQMRGVRKLFRPKRN